MAIDEKLIIEQSHVPEQQADLSVEQKDTSTILEQQPETATEKTAEVSQTAAVLANIASQPLAPVVEEGWELKKVEEILSKDMEKVFLSLDSGTQIKFKQKGEETARKITELLKTGKAKLKKIVSLIVEWLRIIPQVNKYFLEQEAKIKADEIFALIKNKNT
jgi:hypothetical protein